jgi:glutamine cyclotransferase
MFDAPGPQPNGLQATPDGLWILDQVTNQVSLVSYTGEVLRTFDTESDRGSGITQMGEALWLASTYNCKILKVDKASGQTLAEFDTPGAAKTGAHGLEVRDGKLWIATPPSATIYQVDIANGGFEVLRSIPAPGNRPHGLAWAGDDLWCVETNHRAIYRLNPHTGQQTGKIEIPAPYPEPHGMTLWAGYFWYCDAHTRAVCRLPLRNEFK